VNYFKRTISIRTLAGPAHRSLRKYPSFFRSSSTGDARTLDVTLSAIPQSDCSVYQDSVHYRQCKISDRAIVRSMFAKAIPIVALVPVQKPLEIRGEHRSSELSVRPAFHDKTFENTKNICYTLQQCIHRNHQGLFIF